MSIDQIVLGRMEVGASKDLDSITKQVDGIDSSIAKCTEDDNLYKAMQAECKADLESRLAFKLTTLPITAVAWQASHSYAAGAVVRPVTQNGYVYYTYAGGASGGGEPAWPTTPGETVVDSGVTWECEYLDIVYGSNYGIDNTSDWQIKMKPADVSIYQYQNDIVDVKTYSVGNFSNGNKTYRNIVSGFSQSLNWVRIGIEGHSTYVTTIINISIAERNGVTQDIVPGTMKFFTFLGEPRIDINPEIVQYTDFLEYDLDSAKTYFITMFIESLHGTYSGAGNYYYRTGDYSLVENWGTAGVIGGQTRSIKVIQGRLNGSGSGWDGDSIITNALTGWNIPYSLINSKLFGTKSMLLNLKKARSILNSREQQITDRNSILANFDVFTIVSIVSVGNGSIYPLGLTSVDYLWDKTFTITPNSGWVIDKVVIDMVNQGAIGTYTFTNVTRNHTIGVYFKPA